MSDLLALDTNSDSGGESLKMMSLTEEEANAADAQEFNSLKAYGAAEGDMVTFLHVRLLTLWFCHSYVPSLLTFWQDYEEDLQDCKEKVQTISHPLHHPNATWLGIKMFRFYC